jgi:hypothetical protein
VAFIRSLPDNGKLSVRTTRSDGKVKEENFELGAVSEVRSIQSWIEFSDAIYFKIAKACDWADAQTDEPVGSIERRGER